MRARSAFMLSSLAALVSCAAVLGLPDPTLDDSIPIGGGSSSGNSGSGGGGTDGSSGGDAADDVAADAPDIDGSTDAGITCTAQTTWGDVTALDTVNDAGASQRNPYLSPSETAMVFEYAGDPLQPEVGGTLGLATRDASSEPFRPPLPFLVTEPSASAPCLTKDFVTTYFTEGVPTFENRTFGMRRDGGSYQSTEQLGISSSGANTAHYCRTVFDDGTTMYLHRRVGTQTTNMIGVIVRATATAPDTWDASVISIPDGGSAFSPVVRRDELEIIFARKLGNLVAYEILTSRRASTSAPWSAATPVAELNAGSTSNMPGWLSRDGCRLYFARAGANARYQLYMATRPAQ